MEQAQGTAKAGWRVRLDVWIRLDAPATPEARAMAEREAAMIADILAADRRTKAKPVHLVLVTNDGRTGAWPIGEGSSNPIPACMDEEAKAAARANMRATAVQASARGVAGDVATALGREGPQDARATKRLQNDLEQDPEPFDDMTGPFPFPTSPNFGRNRY